MDDKKLLSLINLLRAVVALLAAFGVVSFANGNPGGLTTDTTTDTVAKTSTVTQVTPVIADKNTQISTADLKADAVPSDSVGLALHQDAKDETPPGVPLQQIKQGAAMTEKLASKTLVAPEAPAGAQNYSCSQHPVVNQSALTHKVIGVAMHFTVSPQGSHLGVWRLFNTPSFGASSTFLYEPQTSLCWQLVPLDRKAWAQLSANSYYWSIEIVTNNLTRAQWLATGMIKHGTLANLVADLLHRAGAPPTLVDPVGCVFLAGVTDHSRLECGNTHWDVGPNFPWDVFMKQVRQHYGESSYKPAKPIKVCDAKCRRANSLRAKHKRTHQRFAKNHCAKDHKKGHDYCDTLRSRNRAVHRAAKREHVSLKGTF